MKKTKKWITNILLIIFALVFGVSAFMVGKYAVESVQANKQKNALLDIKNQSAGKPTDGQSVQPSASSGETGASEATEPAVPGILPEYAELYALNEDLVGWIYVPDTNIDYPVMQTDREKDFYLHRDFYREYSSHGMIYADEKCDINEPSDCVVLYGHNKDDGTMFGDMDFFWNENYYKAHKTLYFDTLTTHYEYEIVTVFNTTATLGEGFEYHLFVDAADEAEFDEFVNTCKSLALYDTGVDAQYGDKLLLLSTCEYSHTNGRLVIVAKRVGEVKE